MKNISFKIIGVFVLVAFLASCSSSTEKEVSEEVVVNENVVPNAESTLALEGMVCSMGCVAAIQDELRSTNGVSFAKIDYDTKTVSIKFDDELTNEEELIAAIGNIGDHQYLATPVEGSNEEAEMEEMIETLEEVGTVVNL